MATKKRVISEKGLHKVSGGSFSPAPGTAGDPAGRTVTKAPISKKSSMVTGRITDKGPRSYRGRG